MKNETTAKVVKDNIVISFGNSENPKIWSSQLSETLSFELNITDKKNSITVKKDEGKKETIASYKLKEDAEKAFKNISSAMFKGDKNSVKSKKPWKSILFLMIVIIIFLLYVSAQNRPNRINPTVVGQNTPMPVIGNMDSQSNVNTNKEPVRSGVPIDASEMFK